MAEQSQLPQVQCHKWTAEILSHLAEIKQIIRVDHESVMIRWGEEGDLPLMSLHQKSYFDSYCKQIINYFNSGHRKSSGLTTITCTLYSYNSKMYLLHDRCWFRIYILQAAKLRVELKKQHLTISVAATIDPFNMLLTFYHFQLPPKLGVEIYVAMVTATKAAQTLYESLTCLQQFLYSELCQLWWLCTLQQARLGYGTWFGVHVHVQ